jgi:ABC-type polysaccharide/polyol phosphate export permease
MLSDLIAHRKIIVTLTRNELRTRHLGTFGGFLWSILNPTIMALIYWFVFSAVFYSGRVKYEGFELPYICYFLAGFSPWLLFQETISRSLTSVIDNPNYVKKITFPLNVLAPIQFLASSVTHFVILFVLLVIMVFSGIEITARLFGLIPYYVALAAFTIGICWIVSAVTVFFRDTVQVVNLLLTVWFWSCPIVWAVVSIPDKYRHLLALNPFTFILDGYRNVLFASIAPQPTSVNYVPIIYLMVIAFAFVGGKWVFSRLQPHFADVV